MWWLRNNYSDLANSHFSKFSIAPAAWMHWSAAVKQVLCSSMSLLDTRTSSMRHKVPSSPVGISLILFWKCSGALDTPKGSNISHMVWWRWLVILIVISWRVAFAKIHCWCRACSCASVSSTWGRGWTSRRMLLLRGFKSTHPVFLWGYHYPSTPWSRLIYLCDNSHGFHLLQLIFNFGM